MVERHNLARGANEWSDTYGSLGVAAPAQQAQLPLHILDPWTDADGNPQPFKPYTAEKLEELAESIRKNGVIEPICVRPVPGGRFQIIAGHNRVEAAKLANLPTVPALVRQLDDDQAAISMVDSNLQHREKLLPSEKAFAYKKKLEAMLRATNNGEAPVVPPIDEAEGEAPVVPRFDIGGGKIRDLIAEQSNESREQVRRYLHLTQLLPRLLALVDEDKLSVRGGVELSYLKEEEQELLIQLMDKLKCKAPSMAQAKQLRESSKNGQLDHTEIWKILIGKPNAKRPKTITVKLPAARISSFFPQNTSPEQMEEEIYQALMAYRKNNSTLASA